MQDIHIEEILNGAEGISNGDLAGIYSEVAEQVGVKNAYRLFCHFKGQQLTFPIKFLSGECIAEKICKEYDGKNIRELSRKFDYSESRIRQILREKK